MCVCANLRRQILTPTNNLAEKVKRLHTLSELPNLKQGILRASLLQAAKFRVTPVAGMEDSLLEVKLLVGCKHGF
jgi:hypothetical protein